MLSEIEGRLLHVFNEKEGLLFKGLSFFYVRLENGDCRKIATIPESLIKRRLANIRCINRLMRMEPKCVGIISENELLVSLFDKIWLLDLNKNCISNLMKGRTGFSQVLNFCSDEENIYWGDYGANANYEEVNIYKMNKDHRIKIVYSFPKGTVRHIHNIIYDKEFNHFWILTGDNETKAGIYIANKNWTMIKPFKTGRQHYRAVVAFPCHGGIIYATDSVETDNHIYYVDYDGRERIISNVNGSCIYGTETKDYYFISTTVEPHEGGGIKKMLSNELGSGIKSYDVHIVAVSKKNLSCSVIRTFRKDNWPMKLFQYGRAPLASGQECSTKGVWCYPIATQNSDGKSLYITFDE